MRETLIIDPALPLFDPDALTAAAAAAAGTEKRKNLQVECKNGSVNLDVWLARQDGSEEAPKRAELDVGSKNGSVTVRLVRLIHLVFLVPSLTYLSICVDYT